MGTAWGARAAAMAMAMASLCAAAPARAEPQRFALSMLHFNLQYVAGGLVGFYTLPDPLLELSEAEVEDLIVVESFEPVLDLLARHPTWGANLELQGYMIEVMAARHPGVLDKLRELAEAGQVEVVSFHYSDQLFMAYPRRDWEESVARGKAVFAEHDVPLSGVVFCQEGQAGLGLAPRMAEHGYHTLLWPKNLFSYQRAETPAPLYQLADGVQMVTSRDLAFAAGGDDFDVRFWFVDDGELLATAENNPYFPELFRETPEAIAEAEAELVALEESGYRIATVGAYVAALNERLEPVPPPPLLDGTWQPNSTDGIKRWMGGFGLWWDDERDNDVRSILALAHRELVAAEAAAAAAGLDASEEVAAAFRLLALGQVTDATGINPFRGEIEYGLAHATEVLRLARDLVRRSKDALGIDAAVIDVAAGTVVPAIGEPAETPVEAPFELVVSAGDRTVEQRWTATADGHLRVEVAFGAADERIVSVTFPGVEEDIVYTQGLTDAPVHVPRDGFVFDHFALALSDGLIGLGGDRFVIKDQARVHLAAVIRPETGDVVFADETMPSGEPTTWVFHVVEGEAAAAAKARALNVLPTVRR